MKNLKSMMPIAAFVLGIALVISQSAFKPAKMNKEWGFDPNLSQWIDKGALPAGATGTRCTLDSEEPCYYIFGEHVNPNNEVDPIGASLSQSTQEGTFEVIF